jgi:hypothetical protein
MMNDEPYSYQVLWSAEDQEFVGLCAEYPSLSYLHQDRYTALEGISNLVKDIVADMKTNGESIPEPIAEKKL